MRERRVTSDFSEIYEWATVHLYSTYRYYIGLCISVRFEVFTAVTKKNVVFWDIKPPVSISPETHYASATEPSQLMLCKI
jgi:hypothetical protein